MKLNSFLLIFSLLFLSLAYSIQVSEAAANVEIVADQPEKVSAQDVEKRGVFEVDQAFILYNSGNLEVIYIQKLPLSSNLFSSVVLTGFPDWCIRLNSEKNKFIC